MRRLSKSENVKRVLIFFMVTLFGIVLFSPPTQALRFAPNDPRNNTYTSESGDDDPYTIDKVKEDRVSYFISQPIYTFSIFIIKFFYDDEPLARNIITKDAVEPDKNIITTTEVSGSNRSY